MLCTLEGLLLNWDFPVYISVCSQELLLQSVNGCLLNTPLVCARIWETLMNKNLVLALKDLVVSWRDRR